MLGQHQHQRRQRHQLPQHEQRRHAPRRRHHQQAPDEQRKRGLHRSARRPVAARSRSRRSTPGSRPQRSPTTNTAPDASNSTRTPPNGSMFGNSDGTALPVSTATAATAARPADAADSTPTETTRPRRGSTTTPRPSPTRLPPRRRPGPSRPGSSSTARLAAAPRRIASGDGGHPGTSTSTGTTSRDRSFDAVPAPETPRNPARSHPRDHQLRGRVSPRTSWPAARHVLVTGPVTTSVSA